MKAKNLLKISLFVAVLCALLALTTLAADIDCKVIDFDNVADDNDLSFYIPVTPLNSNGASRAEVSVVKKDNGKFVLRYDFTEANGSFNLRLANDATISASEYKYMKIKYYTDHQASGWSNGPFAANIYLNTVNHVAEIGTSSPEDGGYIITTSLTTDYIKDGCLNASYGSGFTENPVWFMFDFPTTVNNLTGKYLEIEYIAFFKSTDDMNAFNGREANIGNFTEETFSMSDYASLYTNGSTATITEGILDDGRLTATITATEADVSDNRLGVIKVDVPFEANDYGMEVVNLGAQIRVDGENDSLRFGTKAICDLDGVTFGAVVGNTLKKIDNEGTPLNYHNAGNSQVEADGYTYFNTVITGIPADQTGTLIKVTPFITYTVGNDTYTRYFDSIAKSVDGVLEAIDRENVWDI